MKTLICLKCGTNHTYKLTPSSIIPGISYGKVKCSCGTKYEIEDRASIDQDGYIEIIYY